MTEFIELFVTVLFKLGLIALAAGIILAFAFALIVAFDDGDAEDEL